MKKIAFIGFGQMAGAIAEGLLLGGKVEPSDLTASARNKERLAQHCARLGITPASSNEEAVKSSEVVFLAVKPKQAAAVLDELRESLDGKIVISVVAGKSHAELKSHMPETAELFCMIPNTPVAVGRGIFAAEHEHSLCEESLSFVKDLLSSCGTLYFPDEMGREAFSTISGCGPALCAMLMEAFADAGVKHGLQRSQAYRVVAELFEGTAVMLKERGLHPGQLKDEVCSPGGTTILGVAALEEFGARNAMIKAIDRIMDRE